MRTITNLTELIKLVRSAAELGVTLSLVVEPTGRIRVVNKAPGYELVKVAEIVELFQQQ